LSRENYIAAMGHEGEWTPEHEETLPRELQV
jgi:hypothetical protein